MTATTLSLAAHPESVLSAWERGFHQRPFERALTLLSIASPPGSERGWTTVSVGQRDARLIDLREALFGPQLEAVTSCPGCSSPLELSFETKDVRVPVEPEPHQRFQVSIDGYDVWFRLPTSTDLLEVASQPLGDARQHLLSLCIESAHNATLDRRELPPEIQERVIERMAEQDPQANVEVAVTCPSCDHRWSIPFDIASHFWSDVDDWARRLVGEVHVIARAYGWSERDILAMSPRRRRLYLDRIGERP